MNGFEIEAAALRKVLERETDPFYKKDLQNQLEAAEFLAKASEEVRRNIFDFCVYNTTCKGYVKRALDEIKTDPEQRQEIINAVQRAFEDMRAEEAEKYYDEH